ncbi:2-hydroxyacylsphingosine 1-beta-galactosyltransferase isoform X1 [Entelurus aequoreus]|uniref:2-hydroxyacylsphingosine 1-beta-galactosyltransferase isoform X1 n=1 Tax=Entelurus aequoreus TaxID=161455 RepID=UPI002B1D1783|nr:2-hydroxyacylsphingosine 1-beta-galactosyltransferase isoform X1 [Entelurus aequoreus]
MLRSASLLLLLGLLSWRPSPSRAAKILVVPPTLFESHMYIFHTLALALHQEGHEVHFLVCEGREVRPSPHYQLQRYPGIFNSSMAETFLQSRVSNIFAGRLTFLELFEILEHYSQNCDAILGNAEVMARLKRANFQLLLVDPNEMCGFVLAHVLGLKYAVVSTGLWYPTEVCAPAPLSYVPAFNSLLTDRMSLPQRISNTAVYLLENFGVNFILIPKYDHIMKKHGVTPPVAMSELVRGSQMWMLSTDLALEFPRPTLPHVVYVGGILNRPANPLPQSFGAWLNATADHGFVVVSFGAGVKYLSQDIAHKLAGALARLPQHVIWRFSGVPPSNLGNNTKLVDWMPQNDLLGHPNIKAFLSHGGLNSIFEALYHGVPVVGVPLFGDHYDTMIRVTAKGMGIMLHWKSMSQDDLYNALATVIKDTRYRQRAVVLSNIHKDQPEPPVSRVVYWINYILRHNGTQHLRAAVYDISLYQYFLLDVILVVGAALAFANFTLRRLGVLLRATWGGRCHAQQLCRPEGNSANGHCHCMANGSLEDHKKVN